MKKDYISPKLFVIYYLEDVLTASPPKEEQSWSSGDNLSDDINWFN